MCFLTLSSSRNLLSPEEHLREMKILHDGERGTISRSREETESIMKSTQRSCRTDAIWRNPILHIHDSSPCLLTSSSNMLTASSSHFHFCHYYKELCKTDIQRKRVEQLTSIVSGYVYIPRHSYQMHQSLDSLLQYSTIKISYRTCWGGLNFRQQPACWVPQRHTYRWLWKL